MLQLHFSFILSSEDNNSDSFKTCVFISEQNFIAAYLTVSTYVVIVSDKFCLFFFDVMLPKDIIIIKSNVNHIF